MYNIHQKQIQQECMLKVDTCAEALLFVSRSIRNHTYLLPTIVDNERTMGVDAPSLRQGIKRQTHLFVLANKHYLHNILYSSHLSTAEKLLSMTAIPGIGIVKAGFILQLCTGEVGCLDVHNLKMFGFSESSFRFAKTVKQNTALAKCNLYIETCEKLGGPEFLWNNWCSFIADKYPKHFASAEEVSQLHVDLIV